jgi:hypothetical protein
MSRLCIPNRHGPCRCAFEAATSSGPMDTTHTSKNQLVSALISGSTAIVLNTLALKAADLVPLATAKGGLLRLLSTWFGAPLVDLGIASAWTRAGAPAPTSPVFQTGFHLVVGTLMALFYAYALEPVLPGTDAQKGVIYAIAAWVLNAAVVLPATGEGFAGSAHLTPAGIVWFAAAHGVFFMVLALMYGILRRPSGRRANAGRTAAAQRRQSTR